MDAERATGSSAGQMEDRPVPYDDEGGDAEGIEEEDDEEPLLKYQRLGTSVQDLLERDAASCVSASSKVLAVGTQEGKVLVFDTLGHIEVKRFDAHTSVVNDIGFDEANEYIVSCSDDGTVVVKGLYSDESLKHSYGRPIKCVALDPSYRVKKSRQFVSGGVSGQLVLNTKGWLGNKEYSLHSGEGTVHAARWCGSLIAWANDIGVRIYDCVSHQCIKYINRPRGSPKADLFRASLFWQNPSTLIMGWGDTVTVLRAQVQETPPNPADSTSSNVQAALPVFRAVNVVASFQTDYYISGVAPFGETNLVVLAFVSDHHDRESQDAGEPTSPRAEAMRPEVRVVTWMNEELASDALTMHGYAHYRATDYILASWYACAEQPREASADASSSDGQASAGVPQGQWWCDGDEPLYYVVCPKDVVLARPRDADDRVQWMVENERFEEALGVMDSGVTLKEATREQIGQEYLAHLCQGKHYAKAAALCPKLLFGKVGLWERTVLEFAKMQQLGQLCRFIPTEDPRLREAVYDMVLKIFLQTDHTNFLHLVQSWPPSIYNVKDITDSLLAFEARSSSSVLLREALAELHILQGRKDLALGIYLQLQRPGVFEFISANKLLTSVRDKVALLVQLDPSQAVSLLVDHHEEITPAAVVSQMQRASRSAGGKRDGTWRLWLHQYLHSLFESWPGAGAEFHALQVELYAEFEPKLLLDFLTSSHSYSLEHAYEVCERRGLVREMVFLLGRMGNTRQALHLIIDRLADIPQAIAFVREHGDDELWEELVSLSLASPRMVGSLLESIGSYMDPLRLMHRIPLGMPIPNLRDRLIKIITDARTQASLIQGCNDVLKHDRVALSERLHLEAKRALPRHMLRMKK